MDQISLKSRAKINITLDVIGRKPNGYHDLSMIMQTVNLYDFVFIRKMHAPGIKLTTNLKWLPNDEGNIVYKAAKLFKETCGIKTGIFMELNKKIPVSAGLAGGSSNAAATLTGLNVLFEAGLSQQELMDLGVKLGADVPYCILGGTALAEGIGDILTPLPPMPNCYVLVAKPKINVSTANVFQSLDIKKIEKHPDNNKVIEAIKQGDIDTVANNMCNVLETVTQKRYPVIGTIKKLMLEHGAQGAIMSGSGPTVFGIYHSKNQAYKAAYELKLKYLVGDIFITTMYNRQEGDKEYEYQG